MTTQKITIEPVTRIEGHAKVTIRMKEDGSVERAFMHVNEFRGFEKFCEGRLYFEMPQITPRICGICPVSHHLASAKAGDALTGQTPPRPASLLRELMHMGQIIQSHGMHFFELAGPDLLLGFDAAPEIRNVVGLIGADPDLTVKAVMLRKFGQEIIKTLGGRKIHPVFAVPGGVNKALKVEERDGILKGVDAAIETIKIGLKIMKDWAEKNAEDIDKFAVFQTGYLGLTTPENGLELYEGDIRLIDREGKPLEKFPVANYLDYIPDIFVGLDERQAPILLLERMVAIDENVQSAAIKIGYLCQIEGNAGKILLKERIDVGFENNGILESVDFSDQVNNVGVVFLTAANIHSGLFRVRAPAEFCS